MKHAPYVLPTSQKYFTILRYVRPYVAENSDHIRTVRSITWQEKKRVFEEHLTRKWSLGHWHVQIPMTCHQVILQTVLVGFLLGQSNSECSLMTVRNRDLAGFAALYEDTCMLQKDSGTHPACRYYCGSIHRNSTEYFFESMAARGAMGTGEGGGLALRGTALAGASATGIPGGSGASSAAAELPTYNRGFPPMLHKGGREFIVRGGTGSSPWCERYCGWVLPSACTRLGSDWLAACVTYRAVTGVTPEICPTHPPSQARG